MKSILPGIDFGADSAWDGLQDLDAEQDEELLAGDLDLLINVATSVQKSTQLNMRS